MLKNPCLRYFVYHKKIIVLIMGYNFFLFDSIRAAIAVFSCSPMDCLDFMILRNLSANTDTFLWPSDAACFLNFSVAVVNGSFTSRLILEDSEKRAHSLRYTPSSDGE